jgi:hypothetical protein
MAKRIFPSLFILLLALSCLEEPECIGLNNNILGLSFRALNEEATDSVSFDRLFLNGTKYLYMTTATGIAYVPFTDADSDTTIILSSMIVPLNPFSQETTLVFGFGDDSDTLKLSYKSQAQFVSEDCGERYVLSELTAESDGALDSVRIISNRPGTTTASAKNIEILLQ